MLSRPAVRHLALGAARGGVLGAFTLINPHTLTGVRKHLYWLAAGALAAAETLSDEDGVSGSRPALALGITGATYGAKDLLARGDGWTMDYLSRRGVEHPRRLMAALTAVGAVAVSALEVYWFRGRFEEEGIEATPEPLSEDITAIVSGILSGVVGWGAEELRTQLAGARCRRIGDVIEFEVDEHAPRPLLDQYTFPVSATFVREARTHVITLNIEDGKLGWLSQYAEEGWGEHEPEPDWSWPAVDELTFAPGSV
ncbi:hypothetical protein [Enemella sp. A6]|uniref:hypothetical protein n=1 Tax=Enemella sp. A6 TaxID=3440152 RepID=UPI003EBFFFFB